MQARFRKHPERDRFDRFTGRARKVLTLAQEEAHCFHHNYVGTEHVLLGFVLEGEGVAAKVLRKMGVNLEEVRRSDTDSHECGSSAILMKNMRSPT